MKLFFFVGKLKVSSNLPLTGCITPKHPPAPMQPWFKDIDMCLISQFSLKKCSNFDRLRKLYPNEKKNRCDSGSTFSQLASSSNGHFQLQLTPNSVKMGKKRCFVFCFDIKKAVWESDGSNNSRWINSTLPIFAKDNPVIV